jgi:hypothetical protein
MFWDVDFDKIDYDAKAAWVIVRVFERGDVPDIRNCRRYYGDEKIGEVLTSQRWLRKQTVYLASAVLLNKLTDFKCYNIAQSNPAHWNY